MTSLLLDSLHEKRREALDIANRIQVYREIIKKEPDVDLRLVQDVANALELASLDLILERFEEDDAKLRAMRESAADAFRLLRVLPLPNEPLKASIQILRMSALAVLGDKGADAARMLRQEEWPVLPTDSDDWGKRTWATIVDVWLRLIRKKGWEDRDIVLQRIAELRNRQNEFENTYLDSMEPVHAKAAALELIGLYHLAKTGEIFALFITDGAVEGNYQVNQLLDTHFDRVFAVCENARMIELEPLARLLAAASSQMVENSIWTVTRAAYPKVIKFVETLVDKGRGDKALFDVLPPQRRTLLEKGLLGSSRRAVVVSLPTSSGKTLIAQFRILQALNQFDEEEGWVAYLAPSRALVNQVTRQLRQDFAPLSLIVEKVSPALEIDNIEMHILQENDIGQKFRILVTTPEKLDLMLRQGWEEKIGRPLTLVVVDEAHNIQDEHRGLKLELLLATINKECRYAQFLLLTPFIQNAREVARWLGGTSSEDISLSLDWQPNDRAIGIVEAVKGRHIKGRSFDYHLNFETVHTTRKTIALEEIIPLPKSTSIAPYFSQANKNGEIAAITAQYLKGRGPVIVMHARPDWVWSLARKFKIEENFKRANDEDVRLVQEFLRLELGEDFPLIELLDYGIGVHHSGLPEEVRVLMEWLFEKSRLDFLIATTTIAQGINFPVSGVVMASHQYFSEKKGAYNMPAEDFWNIAGRAGRVSQGQLGVIALAANNKQKADALRVFINNNTGDLNSALIDLAKAAGEQLGDLGAIVYNIPEWSSFLQYLVHTYRQMGEPDTFSEEIEQVLRGTLGFEKLRTKDSQIALRLLDGIEEYTKYFQKPGQPLKLVDSTGFSLQSIKTILQHKGNIDSASWNTENLFDSRNNDLQDMMGVLLRVPELRENLKEATGGDGPDGNKLASIVKDWVGGASIGEIAQWYFQNENEDTVTALTKCGQNLFGKLTQTASWGLGALLAITGENLDDESMKKLRNLPSRVFYGVNSDEAIVLRLLGIPRSAATSMADYLSVQTEEPLPKVRNMLVELSEDDWKQAMGANGRTYRRVWRVLEGIDE